MSAFTLPTTLEGWLTLLETRHAKPIDLGLERVGEVYRRLGIQLPGVKFVVAGTNGKGSTCAMLDAILRAAGYRVGLHTSPHLLRFNERIRIDGEELSDEALLPLFEQVELARGDVSLSYFEFTTLVMFLAFSREPLDAVVMEIGLGGRLDAVNLVDADCAIVTSVAIDHAQWLGNDRETIALEKAHIFRPDRPAICSDPQPPQSLVRHAEEIGADLWLLGRDYNYAGDRQQWAWTGRGTRRSGLAYPALRGMNQLLNASGVLAALQAVRGQLPVSAQDIRRGLSLVEMPGRFQVLPGQPTIILDVGHNRRASGGQSGQHGLSPGHLRGLRHAVRQGHRRCHCPSGQSRGSLDLLRSARAARHHRADAGRSPAHGGHRRSGRSQEGHRPQCGVFHHTRRGATSGAQAGGTG